MPDVSKTRAEALLCPQRLENLILATERIRETFLMLSEEVQLAYEKQFFILLDEMDKLARALH